MRPRLLTLVGLMVFGWLLLIGGTMTWTRTRAQVHQRMVLSLPQAVQEARQVDASRRLDEQLSPGANASLRNLWFSSRMVSTVPDGGYVRFASSYTVGTAAWSPDARILAFVSHPRHHADIFLLDIETGFVVPLTTHPAWDYQPTWSPDGKRIAFLSTRDTQLSVYVTGLTPGRVRRLTSQPVLNLAPEWSPDGRAVSFVVAGDSGRRRVTHALSPGTTELADR